MTITFPAFPIGLMSMLVLIGFGLGVMFMSKPTK